MDEAWDIVSKMGVTVTNGLEAEQHLQELGWIVVRTRNVYGLIGHFKDDNTEERYHLTEAQKEWLNNAYEQMNDECRKSVDDLFYRDS